MLETFLSDNKLKVSDLIYKTSSIQNWLIATVVWISYMPNLIINFIISWIEQRTTSRTEWLINQENIDSYKEVAKPWDIIFTRSDWYISNAVISGFWKHTCVYIWKWEELPDNLQTSDIKNNQHYILESVVGIGVRIINIDNLTNKQDYMCVIEKKNTHSAWLMFDEINDILWNEYDYMSNMKTREKISCQQVPIEVNWIDLDYFYTFMPNYLVKKLLKNKEYKPKFFIDFNLTNGSENRPSEEIKTTLARSSRKISHTVW